MPDMYRRAVGRSMNCTKMKSTHVVFLVAAQNLSGKERRAPAIHCMNLTRNPTEFAPSNSGAPAQAWIRPRGWQRAAASELWLSSQVRRSGGGGATEGHTYVAPAEESHMKPPTFAHSASTSVALRLKGTAWKDIWDSYGCIWNVEWMLQR